MVEVTGRAHASLTSSVRPSPGGRREAEHVEKRYELYCRTDPAFYDSPLEGPDGPGFELGRRAVPAGWARMRRADWVVYRPVTGSPPDQGWKIHVSATMDNAAAVLEKTGAYCLERGLAFKFLRALPVLHLHNAKYADRGSSGKFIAVYPADEAELETTLRELGEMLEGEPGPAVLSDLRYGRGPLHVRYGGIAERHRATEDGRIEPAIAAPDGTLVPDRRDSSFTPPPWVTIPAFLRPHLAAQERPLDLPYRVESVLHRTNGGAVYLATDPRTGERVVLKEARPHAGLDACGADAVTRLARERDALERLAGLGVAPEIKAHFTVGEHHYLAMELVPGEPLSSAFGARYPLGGALEADWEARLGRHADWVAEICAKTEDAVTKIHMNGLVFGGLDMSTIMLRPDGGVTLIDFETARPVMEAGGAGLAGPGFAPPPGVTGFDIDRYALACLRFALFLPITELFALDRGKAAELAEVIRQCFPVGEGFLRPAVRIAGGGESRRSPAMVTWRQMRASMTEAILASATPERDDRLFPGDIAQFDSGGLGLAHGAAGVLYALHVTGAGRFPDHEQWLVDRARALGGPASEGPRIGFYDGLHGVAHTLAHLGHHQAALEVLDIAGRQRHLSLGTDLYGGLSGIGLNQVYFGDLGEALNTAALVVDRLPRLVAGISGGAVPYAGLMYGSSGPALLFLRLYEKTGDVQWLDHAETALRQDLHRCVVQTDGSLQVNEGWRTTPYLDRGSVGICWVLGELLHYRADPELAAARERLDRAARSHFYLQSGLFSGRAGILAYLCRDRAGGWGREDPEAVRQLSALSWHAVGYQGHLAFPGERLLRLSMDLATGTAGVLLAVGAALHGEPVRLPFLGGAMPALNLGEPGRSRVEV
ncbi:class III lanthionine synthetase LanKC [Planotetraspora sp. A-T 1434]|uniref:class III lanthionine synthetase LanKC n=1 Tax=Planotetraspora sp. A-T 1434 TaxID=2979219 RepID=UPI0021C0F0BE|nr:class III lanthionine synthetase LanKC [Planotetraspora sp. A-T 1434]MCT9933823.1 class III lanthionine synthetase LanKC [Planotetraspora sp. A-T 1434]